MEDSSSRGNQMIPLIKCASLNPINGWRVFFHGQRVGLYVGGSRPERFPLGRVLFSLLRCGLRRPRKKARLLILCFLAFVLNAIKPPFSFRSYSRLFHAVIRLRQPPFSQRGKRHTVTVTKTNYSQHSTNRMNTYW